MQHTIGILGGMGPAATADMLNKFVRFRHAGQDQQHIPIIACSIPDIPDRSACLLSGGPSPYDYLERYLHMLETAGAECIVIPCNTAHYWFDRLQHSAHAEMINILDATLAKPLVYSRRTLRWQPDFINISWINRGERYVFPKAMGRAR